MSEKQQKSITAVSVKEILETEYGEEEWLIQSLIPAQTVAIVAGSPASFKTWACLHLALCVAEGQPFLGQFPVKEKTNVLILDKENRAKHLKKRLQMMGANPASLARFVFNDDLYLDDEKDTNALAKKVKEENIGLVILDSLIRFHKGDENDSKQMAAVLRNIKRLLSAGANVVFTHHHRKEPAGGRSSANSLRGSSDIFAAVDVHIALERQKKESADILIFRQYKLRQDSEHEPFAVKVVADKEAGKFSMEFVGEHDAQKEKRDEAKGVIVDLLESEDEAVKEPVSIKTIKELTGDKYADGLLRSALAELVQEGKVIEEIGHRNKKSYKSAERLKDDIPF